MGSEPQTEAGAAEWERLSELESLERMKIGNKREAGVRDDPLSCNLGHREWGAGKYHFTQQW